MINMTQPNNRNDAAILAGIFLLIFVILGVWGGLPPQEEVPFFVLGIVMLVIMTMVSGFAAWHLLLRPLPAGQKAVEVPLLTPAQRQWVAILFGISAISLTIAAMWDEIWHRMYGIPFGEDLFWRPHLMMYFGFLMIVGMGLIGWYLILFRGKGSLQQRFRADPIVGIVVLMGTFLMYSLPADPLWHTIYGEDISAWSLPHIVLNYTFTAIAILMATVQLSIMPKREWKSILSGNGQDAVLVIICSFVLTPSLLLLTSEWDMISPERLANANDIVFMRPDWMLPAFLVFCGSFTTVLTNHITQRYGAGILAVITAYLTRALLIGFFGETSIGANNWLLCIPPAIGIDVCYAIWMQRKQQPPSYLLSAAAAVLGMTLIGYPLMNRVILFPHATLTNLPIWLIMTYIAAAMSIWLAATMGNYIAGANKQFATESTSTQSLRWVTPVVFSVVIVFLAWFIVSATPPVA
jgi:hypothetical protein